MFALLLAGLSCGVATYFAASALTVRGRERDASLRRIWRYGALPVASATSLRGRLSGLSSPAADFLLRIRPATDLATIAQKIQAAGRRQSLVRA